MKIQDTESIKWPKGFEPSACPIFVSNQITIQASPETVWYWLTNAPTWHEWYFNASKFRMQNAPDGPLAADSRFRWTTFGAPLVSTVMEYQPFKRLAWDARGIGILAYHAWLIIPTSEGCRVLTEETQKGWVCRIGKLIFPNRMYDYHQVWLEGLKRKAEGESSRLKA